MKKKRTWRWVTRGAWLRVHVWSSAKRPIKADGSYRDDGRMVNLCGRGFKALFGFVPECGQCIKVDFKAKVIK